MARYTTIRVSVEDKRRLERLARLMGCNSLAEAFRRVVTIAEWELERYRWNPLVVLSSLRYARDVGETDAAKVDEYLYSGEKE